MKNAEALRERLKAEIAELQQKLAGVEMTINAMRGAPSLAKVRAPRSNLKKYVLGLLEDVGEQGLNASAAVEYAVAQGERVERGSVSSLLSRLKSDGVVDYDGHLYRLTKYARARGPAHTSGVAPSPPVH